MNLLKIGWLYSICVYENITPVVTAMKVNFPTIFPLDNNLYTHNYKYMSEVF